MKCDNIHSECDDTILMKLMKCDFAVMEKKFLVSKIVMNGNKVLFVETCVPVAYKNEKYKNVQN